MKTTERFTKWKMIALLSTGSLGGSVLLAGAPANDSFWIIEASTDLVNWLPVAAGRCADGELEFLDPNVGNYPHRFYRAVAVP